MRSYWTLIALFASVAAAAEPSAQASPLLPGAPAVAPAELAPARSRVAAAAETTPVSDAAAVSASDGATLTHDPAVGRSSVDSAVVLEHLQGERSRLEAEKQLLALQLDIATLHRKLAELESTPRSMASGSASSPPPVEPPPTVVSRRGFDGHFTAVLRMSSGGRLVVRAGDGLPNGKVEAVDSQGVTVVWYGRRQRLLDAEAGEVGASGVAHSLDLTLPVAPAAVAAH